MWTTLLYGTLRISCADSRTGMLKVEEDTLSSSFPFALSQKLQPRQSATCRVEEKRMAMTSVDLHACMPMRTGGGSARSSRTRGRHAGDGGRLATCGRGPSGGARPEDLVWAEVAGSSVGHGVKPREGFRWSLSASRDSRGLSPQWRRNAVRDKAVEAVIRRRDGYADC
jgi:hypothetical protein